MSEILHIRNFGGISEATIEIKPLTVFIGKEGTGKSVVSKLVYFFRGVFENLRNESTWSLSIEKIKVELLDKFKKYFHYGIWINKEFSLVFKIKDYIINVEKTSQEEINIEFNDNVLTIYKYIFDTYTEFSRNHKYEADEKLSLHNLTYFSKLNYIKNLGKLGSDIYSKLIELGIDKLVTENLYVPAGRSFFSTIQKNIFSFINNKIVIEPILIEFGAFLESGKDDFFRNQESEVLDTDVLNVLNHIVKGEYIRINGEEYILQDGNKIPVQFASSGQQETLPLFILFNYLLVNLLRDSLSIIEEPEAHLFPSSQKLIVDLIAKTYNKNNRHNQFVISTHSPYILTSFNTLLYAGFLAEKYPHNKEKIKAIVPETFWINKQDFIAYEFKDGKINSIMDEEMGMMSDNYLDSVSDELSNTFNALLNFPE